MPSPQTSDVVTETRQLFTALNQGRVCDQHSVRNRIVEMNSRLVQQVAGRMVHRCSLDFDDLVQIGHLGLIKAVERFDPDAGYAFSSFAVPLIRGEILHYLRDHLSPIRVSRRLLELYSRGYKIQKDMINRFSRYPTEAQLCEALNITPERWQQACQAKRSLRLHSLDKCALDDGGESPCLVDLLTAQPQEQNESDLYAHLHYFMTCLGTDARRLLTQRVLDGLSYRELARQEGVSVRVISQRLRVTLGQLRHQLRPMVQPDARAPQLTPPGKLHGSPPTNAYCHAHGQ